MLTTENKLCCSSPMLLKPRSFNYAPNLNNIIMGTEKEKGSNSKDNNGLAKSGGSGLLDTFSLSFVGNLNFSNAINGVQKIIEGIASCKCGIGYTIKICMRYAHPEISR